MATSPLVEHDLERGAALIAALERSNVPLDFVAWSYSEDDEEWRLIISTSLVKSGGRVATYERIREVVAQDPWMDPGVGRVVLVSPDEPGVMSFQELARAPISEDLAIHGDRGVIRGRPVDASYVYNNAALQFEEALFAALQRLAPPYAVLRRAGKVFESPREVDFILDSGHGMVLVEAKATNRAVTPSELASMRSGVSPEAPLIVVSRGGFTPEADSNTLSHVFLVAWRSQDDDPDLREAIQAALS